MADFDLSKYQYSEDKEVWVDLEGFEGYMISDHGGVKRKLKSGIWKECYLMPRCDTKNGGGSQLRITRDGRLYIKDICKMMAEVFIPNPNGYKYAHHIGEEKVCNIEWYGSGKFSGKSSGVRKRVDIDVVCDWLNSYDGGALVESGIADAFRREFERKGSRRYKESKRNASGGGGI